MKGLLVFILSIFILTNCIAQSGEARRQRAQLAVFNVGFNGLIGGLGSLINNKGKKASFQVFAKGFYKGAIGGGVSHVGLSMSHIIETKQNIVYAWPARIVNAVGSSMIQNAAEQKRLFERLHFNLYITRLEYYPYKKKFDIRLFTSSIYGIAVVSQGSRFDLGKSLKSGIFFFESEDRFQFSFGSGRGTGQVSSIGMQSSLQGDSFYRIYAEEVAHIQQYDRKVGGNALAYKLDERWRMSSKFYKAISKYIYLDLNGPIFWLAYKLENSTSCNFFEQEAVNYSNRRLDNCN